MTPSAITPARYAVTITWAMLALAWTATAFATVTTAPSSPAPLDPWMVMWSVIVSTLMGGTALAIRVNNYLLAQDESGQAASFVRPWLFCGAHMGGSWSAGFAGFLIGSIQRFDVHWTLLTVLLLSFGGATALEKLAERYLPMLPIAPPGGRDPGPRVAHGADIEDQPAPAPIRRRTIRPQEE